MSPYASIDPSLESWAERNGVEWIRDNRGWDTRTLYWPLKQDGNVQLWLDEPADGQVVVHLCQNSAQGGQHSREWRAPLSALGEVLDEAFDASLSLVEELKAYDA